MALKREWLVVGAMHSKRLWRAPLRRPMPSHCDPISWSSSWRQEGLHCRGMPKAEENSSSYVKKDVLLLPWRGSQVTSWGWWLVLRPWCLTSKQDHCLAECSQTSHRPYGLLSPSVPFQPHVPSAGRCPWDIRRRLVTLCSEKRQTQSRRALALRSLYNTSVICHKLPVQAEAVDSRPLLAGQLC